MKPPVDLLNEAKRDLSFANQRPKDAATLVLIDRSTPEPKVLLGRRHHGHKFMAGKYVFPGGRVEATDRDMQPATALDPRVEARLMTRIQRPSPAKARAFAMAAIRETAEETGLMLGRRSGAPVTTPGGEWTPFAEHGIAPDLAALHFVARAITPPRRPKRFDTRFFAVDAEAIAHRIDGVVTADTELVELVWMPIKEAETLDLPPITKAVLSEIEARAAAGFGHDLPVPFYRVVRKVFIREEI